MKRRKRRKSQQPGLPAFPKHVWVAGGKSCLWIATLAGLVVGMYALDGYAKSAISAEANVIQCGWIGLPSWLEDPNHKEFLDEIASAARLRPGDDLHTADLCEWIGRNIGESPWVESIQRVSKGQDGMILVEATFRRPVTMIVKAGNAYLVDSRAVRLPRERRLPQLDPRQWILVGGVGGDVPKVGQAWNGKAALAGVKLVKMMNEAYEQGRFSCWPEITRVDVSNINGQLSARDGRIRLQTMTPGALIHWGLPPGEEYPVECSTPDKLAKLDNFFRAHNGFQKEVHIDVRPFDPELVLTGEAH